MSYFAKFASSIAAKVIGDSNKPSSQSYTVKAGDTISKIAQERNLGTSELLAANKDITDANKIQIGQTIQIPGAGPKELMDPDVASGSVLPINIRQFFNPTQDRTNADFSQAELDAFKKLYEYSQTPEARKAKIAKGYNPDTIQYMDYNAFENIEAGDSAQSGGSFKFDKLTEPVYNLKTTLGRVGAPTKQADGSLEFTDIFDFPAKTESTGLRKLGEYVGSIRSTARKNREEGGGLAAGAYAQARNFMGYYGPQEGDGTGGRINLRIKQ